MAASLLAEGTTTITNCPDILDVPLMAEVLRGLGANVELDGSILVRITRRGTQGRRGGFLPPPRQFRVRRSACSVRWSAGASGPWVAPARRATSIGSRPLDMHQSGLRQLGAECAIEHGLRAGGLGRSPMSATSGDPAGALPVGATENILDEALALAEARIVIHRSRELDAVDLCEMSNQR